MAGCQAGEHASIFGIDKNGDDSDEPCAKDDAKQSDVAPLKEEENWELDSEPELTWDEKVVEVLNIVRRREITEYNPKQFCSIPTRFCAYNIAFFDLDKECEYIHPFVCYNIILVPCSFFDYCTCLKKIYFPGLIYVSGLILQQSLHVDHLSSH